MKPAGIIMQILTLLDRERGEAQLNEIMGQQLALFVTGNTECDSVTHWLVLSSYQFSAQILLPVLARSHFIFRDCQHWSFPVKSYLEMLGSLS